MTEQIIDVLIHKLCHKGLNSEEITRLVKDVFVVIGDGGNFTLEDINHHLHSLGWQEQIMDGVVFELILWTLENHDLIEYSTNSLH